MPYRVGENKAGMSYRRKIGIIRESLGAVGMIYGNPLPYGPYGFILTAK